ncbi:MAG: hypothetical protein WEB88_03300, partial [Gemmatimonadota bacterium]
MHGERWSWGPFRPSVFTPQPQPRSYRNGISSRTSASWIRIEALPRHVRESLDPESPFLARDLTLKEIEREHILKVMALVQG